MIKELSGIKLNTSAIFCIFHQKMIMRRYLTKKLKLEQNTDLKDI